MRVDTHVQVASLEGQRRGPAACRANHRTNLRSNLCNNRNQKTIPSYFSYRRRKQVYFNRPTCSPIEEGFVRGATLWPSVDTMNVHRVVC